MKFKRTIASLLAAVFSLTLMGSSAPRTFAEETPEIKTEKKLDSKTQEIINQEVKKLDEQGKLNELKEKVKKEKIWSFTNGINKVIKKLPEIIMFSWSSAIIQALMLTSGTLPIGGLQPPSYWKSLIGYAEGNAIFLTLYHFIMQ